MIYISNNAKNAIEELFYYPWTIGTCIEKSNSDLNKIRDCIYKLPAHKIGQIHEIKISSIGSFKYTTLSDGIIVHEIIWCSTLARFYFTKSNFITFTKSRNIASVHPSYYKVRNADSFKCDNEFKVISRKYHGRELFNFIDKDGKIISDIDFTQVKPFSKHRNMTARGYTPDRRCYMIFDDGNIEEMNENVTSRAVTRRKLYESIMRDVAKIVKRHLQKELTM